MVAYTVEGSNKVFSTWTDAKNHAASVVARRKTDSKVSIKRNGEPYGEMWRQNGKIKYTTPCKPHTMAIPDSKPKQTAKKASAKAPAKTVPKTAQKTAAKKAPAKKRTETPVKATKTVEAVSVPKSKPKSLAEPKSAPKKSKPKAIESPKAVKAREIPALPEPRREVRERRYEPAPELLGPGAQRRDRSTRSAAPALSFPALSWDEGAARHEANRARREERRSKGEIAREERRQAREDRKFARQQKRAEREMRRHIYVDEPDDPEPDGARARPRGDDGRRRAGEGTTREIVRTRAPYNTYDAPDEIEAPKGRRVVPSRSGTRQLPPPRSDTTTATTEDGRTIEVEIIPPKRDRRRTPCPTAAIAHRRWGWPPHPSLTSAGCSRRPWTARRRQPSTSTRASARRYSRELSCASATDMGGGSATAPTGPSSRTDPWSGATDRASPSPNPFRNPLRSRFWRDT